MKTTNRLGTPLLLAAAALAFGLALMAGAALADRDGGSRRDGHDDGERRETSESHRDGRRDGRKDVALAPRYVQECGSCHVPYPPGLLDTASWRRQMDGLARHYGSDASLDAAAAGEIGAWLQANAGSGRRVQAAPPEGRITQGAWFRREHDEVGRATWALARSASNCEACHTRAAEGRYREREIRLPR